jgi:hypothetical protein
MKPSFNQSFQYNNFLGKEIHNELTQIHNVIATNGTIINNNVPGPQCDSVPLRGSVMRVEPDTNLFHFKAFFNRCFYDNQNTFKNKSK